MEIDFTLYSTDEIYIGSCIAELEDSRGAAKVILHSHLPLAEIDTQQNPLYVTRLDETTFAVSFQDEQYLLIRGGKIVGEGLSL